MVDSYNDPVKQAAREKLLQFASKNLDYKRSRDIKVVCFPGAEKDGEEALEVKEVYAKMGIPPGNITGLEKDPLIAQRLRNANLGINVIENYDWDFFSRTNTKFDIISLDYLGQQTQKQLETLEIIARRGILNHGGILCTNYSAKREGKPQKESLTYRLMRGSGQLIFPANIQKPEINMQDALKGYFFSNRSEDAFDDFTDYWLKFFDFCQGSQDMGTLREGMTTSTIRAFSPIKFNGIDFTIFNACPDIKSVDEKVKNFIDNFNAQDPDKDKSGLTEWDSAFYESAKAAYCMDMLTRCISQLFQKDGIKVFSKGDLLLELLSLKHAKTNFREKRGSFRLTLPPTAGMDYDPEEVTGYMAAKLASCLFFAKSNSYVPSQIERYSYNSNKNTLMHFDLFKFLQSQKLMHGLDQFVKYYPTDNKIVVNPNHFDSYIFVRRLWAYLKAVDAKQKEAHKFLGKNLPEREYLGSSYRRNNSVKEKEIEEAKSRHVLPKKTFLLPEDKKRILQLFRFGSLSPKEIHRELFGETDIKWQQVAAICAWETRRNSLN